MAKYPKIIIDDTKNSPNDMRADFSTEHFYDFMHHTHKLSDLINDGENSESTTSYDDTELRELISGKVDAVEGKSLVDDAEIARLAEVSNYDDTQIREDFDKALEDRYNMIMGITDEDSTTVDEAYDTLKEVSKYIKEDGEAATEMLNRIAAIEESCNTISESIEGKVNAVEGKSLVDDAEIARLAEVSNYDDTQIRELIEGKLDAVEGKSLMDDTEIARLANVTNYDDTEVRNLIGSKVDAVEGKSLMDDTEIERLASVNNYDDTEVREAIGAIVQYDKETVEADLVADHYIDTRSVPYYNEELNTFFANGVPITVDQDPDNAAGVIISWGFVGSIKITDASKLNIYGGGDGYLMPKTFAHTKVTVNSGTIRNIFGGGDMNTVVDTAEVIINGGKLTSVSGGSTGWSVPRNIGGGMGIVYKANLTINDGNIFLVYGSGGSGDTSITEEVNLTMNGGTVNYFTAGGSNGATEHAVVNINGGSINVCQSTNRGYTNNVEFNMTDGHIANAYCGGETADDVSGTIKSYKCNITGGTIDNFSVGTDGSTAKDANKGIEYVEVLMSLDKISGVLADGVTTNISDELKNKLQ